LTEKFYLAQLKVEKKCNDYQRMELCEKKEMEKGNII